MLVRYSVHKESMWWKCWWLCSCTCCCRWEINVWDSCLVSPKRATTMTIDNAKISTATVTGRPCCLWANTAGECSEPMACLFSHNEVVHWPGIYNENLKSQLWQCHPLVRVLGVAFYVGGCFLSPYCLDWPFLSWWFNLIFAPLTDCYVALAVLRDSNNFLPSIGNEQMIVSGHVEQRSRSTSSRPHISAKVILFLFFSSTHAKARGRRKPHRVLLFLHFPLFYVMFPFIFPLYLHHRRWAQVTFSPLSSVHLFFCEQDISNSCGRIWTKLGGQVGCVTRTNWFKCCEGSTVLKFLSDSSPLRDRAKSDL